MRRKIALEAQDDTLAGLAKTSAQRQLQFINEQEIAEEEGDEEQMNLLDQAFIDNAEMLAPSSSTRVADIETAKEVIDIGIRQQKDFVLNSGLFVEEEGVIKAKNEETLGEDLVNFYTDFGIGKLTPEQSKVFSLVEELSQTTSRSDKAKLISQIKEIDPEWEQLFDPTDAESKARFFEVYQMKANQFIAAKRKLEDISNIIESERIGLELVDPRAPIFRLVPELAFLDKNTDSFQWAKRKFDIAELEFEAAQKAFILNKNLTKVEKNNFIGFFDTAVEVSSIGRLFPAGISSEDDFVENLSAQLQQAGIEFTEEQRERLVPTFWDNVREIGGSLVGIIPELMLTKRVVTGGAKLVKLDKVISNLQSKKDIVSKGMAFMMEAGLEEVVTQKVGFEPGTGAIFYGTGRVLGGFGLKLKGKFGSIISPMFDRIFGAGISAAVAMETAHVVNTGIEAVANDEDWKEFIEKAGYGDLSQAAQRILIEAVFGGALGMPFKKTAEQNSVKIRMTKLAEEFDGLGKTEDAALIRKDFVQNVEQSTETSKQMYNFIAKTSIEESASLSAKEKVPGREPVKGEPVVEPEAKPAEEFEFTPSNVKELIDRGFKSETLDKATPETLRRLVEEKEITPERIEVTEKEAVIKEEVKPEEPAKEEPVVEKVKEEPVKEEKAEVIEEPAKEEKIEKPEKVEEPTKEEVTELANIRIELTEKGFTEKALERATPETLKKIQKEEISPEDINITKEGKLELIKEKQPTEAETITSEKVKSIERELTKIKPNQNPTTVRIKGEPIAKILNELPKKQREALLPEYRKSLEQFKGAVKEGEKGLTKRILIVEETPKKDIDKAIEKAKKDFDDALRESPTGLTQAGFIDINPNVVSKMAKLGVLYARKGIKTATEFAKRIGQELTPIIENLWKDVKSFVTKGKPSKTDISLEKLSDIERESFNNILDKSIKESEGEISKLRSGLSAEIFSHEFAAKHNPEKASEFKKISDALKNIILSLEGEADITRVKDIFDLTTGKIKASELIEKGQRGDIFKGNPTAEKVEATFKKQRDDFNDATKTSVGNYFKALKKGFITKFVDVSGNLKNELMDAGGIDVIIKKDLVAGSSKAGRDEYLKSEKEIFEGLTKPQEELLADMIQSQSTIEIHKLNDARGEKRTKRPGGIQLEEAQEHLNILKKNDVELFDKLQGRAGIYFNKLQELLKRRFDEGIISQESFDALKDNVRYSPSLYLKFLVEPSSTNSLGGNKISVSKSDIKKRGEGSESSLFNDPRFLLKDAILRVNKLVFKNKASKALFDFAKENPENKIVTIDKPIRVTKETKQPVFKETPLGFERISVLIDGKQNSMLMQREWAEEWIAREPAINQALANSLRVASGGFILRPMATGINPAFALSNVPRDIAHVLLVTDIYSPVLPIALKQIAADIAKVTPDVLGRKGRYDEYIKEGGGMEFLTQQGGLTGLKTKDIPTTAAGKALKALEYYTGFFNESSELLIRLAIRERSINKQLKEFEKKGIEPIDEQLQEIKERATWEARNQLDFAQGGSWMKALDNIFPYANASMQGARTFLREAVRNPKVFAFKAAQIGGFAAGLYLYNLKQEGWDDISDDIKRRNFIFMTPIWKKDDQGRKKHFYISIPKSPDQIIITGLFEGLAHWTNTGELPQKKMIKELSDAIPFFPIARDRPPMLETFMAYESNWDNFRDTKIWKGQKVENWAEFYKDTPAFYKDIGKAFDLSPARLEAASAKTTTMLRFNVYGIMGLKAYDLLQEGFTETEKEEMNKSFIEHADNLAHPIYRRLLKETTPGVSMESLERFTIEENTRKKIQNDKVKDFIIDIDEETANKSDFERWIQEQPEVDRDRLTNMFDLRQQRKDVDYFWIEMAFMPSPEVKAFVFYNKWKDGTEAEKKEMVDTINKVGKINTERFRIRFAELSNGIEIPGGVRKGRKRVRRRGGR